MCETCATAESGHLIVRAREAADEVIIGDHNSATAVLALSGGELTTPLLSQGDGGTFSFIGGELHADLVDFDLENNGGTLAPGNPADVTLIDPNREWTVKANTFASKSRNCPFQGWSLKGKAVVTIVEGEIVTRGE